MKRMETKIKSISKTTLNRSNLQTEIKDLKMQKEFLTKERHHFESLYGEIYNTKILKNLVAVKDDLVKKLSNNDQSCKTVAQILSEKISEYLKKSNSVNLNDFLYFSRPVLELN